MKGTVDFLDVAVCLYGQAVEKSLYFTAQKNINISYYCTQEHNVKDICKEISPYHCC